MPSPEAAGSVGMSGIRLLLAGHVMIAGAEVARAVASWWAWNEPQAIGGLNRIDLVELVFYPLLGVTLIGIGMALAGLVRLASTTRNRLVRAAVPLYVVLWLAYAGDFVLFAVADSPIALA